MVWESSKLLHHLPNVRMCQASVLPRPPHSPNHLHASHLFPIRPDLLLVYLKLRLLPFSSLLSLVNVSNIFPVFVCLELLVLVFSFLGLFVLGN